MKKKESIRAILGLTQQEMAMLLKVNRSQWSMYESNKRNLPSEAALKLHEMVGYILTLETKAFQNILQTTCEKNKTIQILQQRLEENEWQLQVKARKIMKTQENVAKYERVAQLMVFLNAPEQLTKAAASKIVPTIASAAIKNYSKNKSQLDLLQIDRELLEIHRELLQKKLRELE